MMSIFDTPPAIEVPDSGIKVLFLHGLEGSQNGDKAVHLREKWGAQTPSLRTNLMISLKEELGTKSWQEAPKKSLEKALSVPYADAWDSVRYYKPDVIVGSSLGGALLAKMVLEGKYKGRCVFLAPAISEILGDVSMPQMKDSVWVLGECDTVVINSKNIKHAINCSGHVTVSPGDSHRLHLALENGFIDAAITTSLELSCHM
jgi:hypothetical protein